MMIAQHISIGYRGKTIFSCPELVLEQGAFTVLIGPNGAGKSSLLRTLAGLQKPMAGRIALGGKGLDRMSPHERAREIGLVLTERIETGYMTGFELVALGRYPYTGWSGALRPEDTAVVEQALSDVDATALRDRLVFELSDGERQRLLFARALAQEPRVLLADEPTAFLDFPHRTELMGFLKNWTQTRNTSVLLSTHDLHLALQFADVVWLIHEHTISIGRPSEVVAHPMWKSVFPMWK